MIETDGQLTLEERATNFETMKHIQIVQKFLHVYIRGLLDRAEKHDQSKLGPPEVAAFTENTGQLAGSTYGSEEYEGFRKRMGQALDHHYAKNRHHPEHWPEVTGPEVEQLQCDIARLEWMQSQAHLAATIDGPVLARTISRMKASLATMTSSINRMDLVDILEMLADWKAATMRHHNGNIRKSLAINQERFKISPQLSSIMANTVDLFEE